jgi:hypothetical protein
LADFRVYTIAGGRFVDTLFGEFSVRYNYRKSNPVDSICPLGMLLYGFTDFVQTEIICGFSLCNINLAGRQTFTDGSRVGRRAAPRFAYQRA